MARPTKAQIQKKQHRKNILLVLGIVILAWSLGAWQGHKTQQTNDTQNAAKKPSYEEITRVYKHLTLTIVNGEVVTANIDQAIVDMGYGCDGYDGDNPDGQTCVIVDKNDLARLLKDFEAGKFDHILSKAEKAHTA